MRRCLLLLFAPSCFYVTEAERQERFDLDGDGFERPFDCNDGDPGVGEVATRYADVDGDGFGDPDAPVAVCGAEPSTVDDSTDCDDDDPDTHPGADEACDDADNDCDDQVDEDQSDLEWYRDADGDGFGDPADSLEDCAAPAGYVPNDRDCDDDDDAINPDGIEVCGGVDDDCDDLVDEVDPDLTPDLWFHDGDGDGYGTGAGAPSCAAPSSDSVRLDGDCDDSTTLVSPDADEVCNGVDDDCDEDVDSTATDRRAYYPDGDGDGYGDAASPLLACPPGPGSGYSTNASDCDDFRGDVHPTAPECDDGVDNDCDPLTMGDPC
jgi:hypothetical protein